MTTVSANGTTQNSGNILQRLNSSIRAKIVVLLLATAMIPLIILSGLQFVSARNSLNETAFEGLDSVRALKKNALESYFQSIEDEVLLLAENPLVADAAVEFWDGFAEFEGQTPSAAELNELQDYYNNQFGAEYLRQNTGGTSPATALFNGVEQDEVRLQHRYLAANPAPLGAKNDLVAASTGSNYDAVHGEYHPYFNNVLQRGGYYDIFIADLKGGNIIYSVFKEVDFATSLTTGPYANSGIGQAYQMALGLESAGEFVLTDYATYQPSYDAPASFIATPIFDGSTKVGILIVQIPLDEISAIMVERTGLGESGETYLVGNDNLWRSDSRFLDTLGTDSTILKPEFVVDTTATQSALVGGTGREVIDDYRGFPVLSSWESVTLGQEGASVGTVTWALMAEIDQAEAETPARNLLYLALGAFALLSLAVVGASFWFSNRLTEPLDEINIAMDKFANDDFDARIKIVSNDELAIAGRRINEVFDQQVNTLVRTREENEKLQGSIFNLLTEVSDFADGDLTVQATVDEGVTGSIADSFNFMAENLRDVIGRVQDAAFSLSTSANEIQTSAEQLNAGSELQASQIVDTTAAIDEMAVSIQQVSQNSALSESVGEEARLNAERGGEAVRNTIEGMGRIRSQVQNTSKRIKRLGESTQEIGEMLLLIRTITKRTSILALNAAIQASRAGEAGQSFMVVAEEVEQLAERSAAAAKQIEGLVQTIQTETNEAVSSMEATTHEVVIGSQLANEAGNRLNEIESVSARLSDLVQSISRSAQQQAKGSESIAASMNEIAQVTRQTSSGTKEQTTSINTLAELADELRSAVSSFKIEEAQAA